MKYSLNLEADKPTVNGRIYSKDIILEAFDGKEIPVYFGKKPVGSAKCSVLEDGAIISEITIEDTPAGNVVKTLIEANVHLQLTSAGQGSCYEDRPVVIKEFTLEHLFFFVPDEERD